MFLIKFQEYFTKLYSCSGALYLDILSRYFHMNSLMTRLLLHGVFLKMKNLMHSFIHLLLFFYFEL